MLSNRTIIGIYVLAFAIGTLSHALDLLYQFPPYQGYAMWMRVFWTSLVLVDPIVILLLLQRQRVGALAALGVMVLDVAVNTHMTYSYWNTTFLDNPSLWIQGAFAVFVVLTCRRLRDMSKENGAV